MRRGTPNSRPERVAESSEAVARQDYSEFFRRGGVTEIDVKVSRGPEVRTKRLRIELVRMEIHGEAPSAALGEAHAPVDHRRGQRPPEPTSGDGYAQRAELDDRQRELDQLAIAAPDALGRRRVVRNPVTSPAKRKHARGIAKPEREKDVVEPEAITVHAEVGGAVADRRLS